MQSIISLFEVIDTGTFVDIKKKISTEHLINITLCYCLCCYGHYDLVIGFGVLLLSKLTKITVAPWSAWIKSS